MDSTSSEKSLTVGNWEVYPTRNLLTGPDGDVHVEPKVMQVLERLMQTPGEVVTRTELLDELWGGQ